MISSGQGIVAFGLILGLIRGSGFFRHDPAQNPVSLAQFNGLSRSKPGL